MLKNTSKSGSPASSTANVGSNDISSRPSLAILGMIAASHGCDELNKTGSPASGAGISSTMAASSRPSLAILGMIAASPG
jgi:hypothetical protein